ncbi:glycoside hydrolase family 172 protein [Acidaminobacter sp. JC074]|uniref:glycoside hydrolase family 172 protein n=1 Tax=Acidaminobacter sp. JC074 TaxID=2530199 RepID=UPI001F0CEF8D|nr:glycoside hydrolase family 172 protein [Acidaminobacter sp. JC074]
MFNGIEMGLGNLSKLSDAKSRSISAENFSGEKGKAGMAEEGTGKDPGRFLGKGWKISPSIMVPAKSTVVLADIEGPGVIQSLWMTGYIGRDYILRIYWDHQEQPSVECPLGDFFASGWTDTEALWPVKFAPVNSVPVAVNPKHGLNCFWSMPFRNHCKITLENRNHKDKVLYYQINYSLTDVSDDCGYFHAQFRRSNPVKFKEDHVILDGVEGKGHYVGTAYHIGLNGANDWWGEGEIKFYLDGDQDYPTICGTGTEDYFGGAWNWDVDGEYKKYSTPFSGMHQIIQPNGLYISQQRFAMYRWHIMDPIRFDKDLKVTIQDLGCQSHHWNDGGAYLARQDDIATVAYWYQTLPTKPFPDFPDREGLKVI